MAKTEEPPRNQENKSDIAQLGSFIVPDDVRVPESVETLTKDCPTVRPGELHSSASEARLLVGFAGAVEDYKNIARGVRSQPGLFLKPLLMLCRESNPRWAPCVDEELLLPISPTDTRDALDRMKRIGERAEKYRPLDDQTRVSRLHEMLVLRYLDIRPDRTLIPTPNVQLSDGYEYPLASALAEEPGSTGRDLLESLRAAGLIRGTVMDRVHVCPSCEDFRLNFREVCPHCSSLTFAEEATVHHFRCSYVGRKSEFERNEALICPKCERRLRHVGVDYDKPRQDFWCHQCDRQFEEPGVECHCLNCGKTVSPGEADVRTYWEYAITPEGKLSAQEGDYPETHVAALLRESHGLYSPKAFDQLYDLEVARCQRYEVPATLAGLRIEKLTEIVRGRGGRQLRRVTADLKELFAGTFRETDLLTDVSQDHVLIIFTHTPADDVEHALKRLENNLRELVDERLEVESRIFDLAEDVPELAEVRKRNE